MITNNDALHIAIHKLSQSRYITVDTEFLRENTFWAKLCLIQVASPNDAYLIDTLSENMDLTPFYNLLCQKKVIKVMHGCRQDIEIFYHASRIIPYPLMDTQIMAMVTGLGEAISYENLVRHVVKKSIDKSSRFTDWSQRPLSEKQLNYALSDVTYLCNIFEYLEHEININKRIDWIKEEMDILQNPKTYISIPEDAWKKLKIQHYPLKSMGIIMKIAEWREEQAQKRNIPRRHLLKDEALREMALQAPKNIEELSRLRIIPKKFSRSSDAQEILTVIQRGINIKKSDLPILPPKIDNKPHIGSMIELLKVLLKHISDTYNVAQKLIAQVSDLERIASDDTPKVKALEGWRMDIFGQHALNLKYGRIALTCQEGKTVIIPVPQKE